MHVHGPRPPDVATSKYNMAGVHEAQGNVQEARLMLLESAAICAQVYGADHEETLDAARRAATVGHDSDEEEEDDDEEVQDSQASDDDDSE